MLNAKHLVLIGSAVIREQAVQSQNKRHSNARLKVDRAIQGRQNTLLFVRRQLQRRGLFKEVVILLDRTKHLPITGNPVIDIFPQNKKAVRQPFQVAREFFKRRLLVTLRVKKAMAGGTQS